MNETLWNQLSAFNFEENYTAYGFTQRLATENNWTINFTLGAITEYKKFMYLAATAGEMVSPSETVDIVWHQHLIFTRSYDAFCTILGKKIAHIPSTHNRNEQAIFQQATQTTTRLYTQVFGRQPAAYWEKESMWASLSLTGAGINILSVNLTAIVVFVLCLLAAYPFFLVFYAAINNPVFLPGYIGLVITAYSLLHWYNRRQRKKLLQKLPTDSFVFDLHPFELIYLKNGNLSSVIHGVVNDVLDNNQAILYGDNTIELNKDKPLSNEQYLVITTLKEHGRLYYGQLVRLLIHQPFFAGIKSTMSTLTRQIRQSTDFIRQYAVNVIVIALVLLPGLARVGTGIAREKPVTFILILVIVTFIIAIVFLKELYNAPCNRIIPLVYEEKAKANAIPVNNWQWNYFLLGTAALIPAFVPVTGFADQRNRSVDGSGGGCSSGCSSGGSGGGCGSGCGGGCGGCGS